MIGIVKWNKRYEDKTNIENLKCKILNIIKIVKRKNNMFAKNDTKTPSPVSIVISTDEIKLLQSKKDSDKKAQEELWNSILEKINTV
ncbi:MAG: hypothetical protein K5776_04785 [Lachnospiraceae bacterium]|nr:hypothetical protein [Lachnospiraceae bacterium]